MTEFVLKGGDRNLNSIIRNLYCQWSFLFFYVPFLHTIALCQDTFLTGSADSQKANRLFCSLFYRSTVISPSAMSPASLMLLPRTERRHIIFFFGIITVQTAPDTIIPNKAPLINPLVHMSFFHHPSHFDCCPVVIFSEKTQIFHGKMRDNLLHKRQQHGIYSN